MIYLFTNWIISLKKKGRGGNASFNTIGPKYNTKCLNSVAFHCFQYVKDLHRLLKSLGSKCCKFSNLSDINCICEADNLAFLLSPFL
uniref:Uncharacterized protein n=1 Tax=Trichogramma kaykai TaxID=54128 RepID=A0ABD2VTW5_9HYME